MLLAYLQSTTKKRRKGDVEADHPRAKARKQFKLNVLLCYIDYNDIVILILIVVLYFIVVTDSIVMIDNNVG